MAKKIYGAPDKIDWVCEIKVGGCRMRVPFAGGALSGYGATPARFSTADPAVQTVIESSRLFRDGAIVLLKELGSATVAPEQKAPLTSMEFPDWESARDWAVETFETSRTNVRTREKLLQLAKANGFDIIVSD